MCLGIEYIYTCIYLKRDFYSSAIMGIDSTLRICTSNRKMLKKVRLIKYHQIDIVRQVLFGKSPWFITCRHVINPSFVVIDSIPVFYIIMYSKEYHCVVTKGQLIVLIITLVDRNTYHKHLHIKIFLHALLLFARTLSVVNISNAYQTFITVTHT